MKRFSWLLVLAVAVFAVACSGNYGYDTVEGDKLGTRIYTLDNGLKVYMSVNKEQPRLQTMIAVRVGSKNDPAETLAEVMEFQLSYFNTSEIML